MDFKTIIDAIVLGVLEGFTEFLPVSSTAHLLLAEDVLGFKSVGGFTVLIQLGAILALLGVYAARLWQIITDLPRDRRTQPLRARRPHRLPAGRLLRRPPAQHHHRRLLPLADPDLAGAA